MCILFIANNVRPEYPLIVAANRDEFFARPSRAAHFWEDIPDILAGRDEQAGGSWLGVNCQGQFAAVTNFRMPSKHSNDARSRGDLVAGFLAADQQQKFVQNLDSSYTEYNPFNLVTGDSNNLTVFSSEAPGFKKLKAGCHPISNGLPDDHWPKMSRGTAALRAYLKHAPEVDASYLAGLLRDSTRAPINELPNTGIGNESEHALSSIFIDTLDFGAGEYGTRTSTVLLFNHKEIRFHEYNYQAGGVLIGQQEFRLTLETDA
ncbi:MAG: NRDE family protein [Proteobacteria bacterium]|nr:NRDE family protein [Pseudomonadota bacterium]